jgi:hypothetical protein
MKSLARAIATAIAAALLCAATRSGNTPLHPPAAVLQSLAQLREIGSLNGLPAEIRQGRFTLPDGTTSAGWSLAAPGAKWNSTDSITDPSLPGRRMILAACTATICLLHYERGGIALIDLIMSLTQEGKLWKVTWLAYGHPPAKSLAELRALLQNRSTLVYHDDTSGHLDY